MRLLLSLALVIGLFNSCCATKDKVMVNYTSGIIIHSSEENDCAYTIHVTTDGNELFLDPINLENEYMENGLKVQFQYKTLKMKNRCNKANPISLTNITKK